MRDQRDPVGGSEGVKAVNLPWPRPVSRRKQLEQYNPNAICPKCHFIGIATEWKPEETNEYAMRRYFRGYGELVLASEHLKRTCFNCKHVWMEAPLDAKGVDETQGT